MASALAGPVALAGAFGTFGTAMWTNIHVDGNPEASTLATMLAVAPIAGLFLAPSVVLVAVARHARLRGAQRVFAIVGVRSLALFTLGYGLAPILALSILWVATHIAVRRKLSVPPFDLILVASHWTLFAFFAYVESHR